MWDVYRRYTLCVWILIVTLVTCSASAGKKSLGPRFKTSKKYVSINRGETAILQCIIANLGTKTVMWRKANTTSPLTIGTYTYIGNASYQVVHNTSSGEWNLKIKNAQPWHSGEYECQISAKEPVIQFITLNVSNTPVKKKQDVEMGGTQVVEKGNAIILECNATGGDYPPEDVDWFKDGQKINADAASKIDITKHVSIASKMLFSKLYIKHSRMEDAGIYLCRSSGKNVKFLNVNVLNAGTFNVKRGNVIGIKDNTSPKTRTFAQEAQESKDTSGSGHLISGTKHMLTYLCWLLPMTLFLSSYYRCN